MAEIQPTLDAIDEAIDGYVTWSGYGPDVMVWSAEEPKERRGVEMTALEEARQKLHNAVEALRITPVGQASAALAAIDRARREFDLARMAQSLPTQADIDELARAGDLDGLTRAYQAQHEHAIAQFEAERETEADRRRTSADPYERAAQARRDGDPNWRAMMPLRWRVSRWWWIWSTPLAMTAAIIGGAIALFWWLT